MSEVNPFAAPLTTDLAVPPAQSQQNHWVFRKGNLLVMHKEAALPDRCVKSNQPAEGRRLKRKLEWCHSAIYLTLLLLHPFLIFLAYLIVSLIFRKRATIFVGLSEEWFRKRRRRIALSWSLVLGGVALAVASGFLADRYLAAGVAGLFVGIAVILVGAFYGAISARLVAAKRITADYIWLKGVHPEFLAMLPDWPYEP